MEITRRSILKAGAAAAATAAVPGVFAKQTNKAGTGKFYEKGAVRIYYEEAGSAVHRAHRSRPAVGILCRRPTRLDGPPQISTMSTSRGQFQRRGSVS
jgi:hypothetical protein